MRPVGTLRCASFELPCFGQPPVHSRIGLYCPQIARDGNSPQFQLEISGKKLSSHMQRIPKEDRKVEMW